MTRYVARLDTGEFVVSAESLLEAETIARHLIIARVTEHVLAPRLRVVPQDPRQLPLTYPE